MQTHFEWHTDKARRNLIKHQVSFEMATRAFADPLAVTVQDRIEAGELRWQTLGCVDGQLLLLIAHTVHDEADGSERIRMISARRATPKERYRYEQNRACHA